MINFEVMYEVFNGEENVCISCSTFTGILALKYKTCSNSASAQALTGND